MLGIYIRKSRETENQKSIKEQVLLGEEFAIDNGFKYKFYNDDIISGTINDRPEFNKMIQDIETGKLRGIYIWNTDRAARDEMAWQKLAKALKENDCLLYDNGVEVDLNNENSYLFYSLKSSMDAHFARVTSKKIKTVLDRNAKEGKAHGKVMPIGYMKDESGYYVLNPDEVPIVNRIYEMSLSGKGYQTIANYLNDHGIPTRYNKLEGTITTFNKYTSKPTTKDKKDVKWSAKTVQDIIKNPLYKGKRKWGDKYYEAPSIFGEAYWHRVNENLKNNRHYVGKQNEHDYLLNRVIECGICNRNYNGRKRSNDVEKVRISEDGKVRKDKNYYTCGSKRYRGQNCGNKNIQLEPLEEFIWKRFFGDKYFLKLVNDELQDNKSEEKIKVLNEDIKTIKSTLKSLEKVREKAINLVLKGILKEEDLEKALKENDKEKENEQLKLNSLENQLQTYLNAGKELKSIKKNLKGLIYDTDNKTKKNIIEKYIKRIYVRGIDKYKAFEIGIDFNLPIKWEHYLMDYKYRFAINVQDGFVYGLADEKNEPWLFRISKEGIKGLKISLD